MKQVLQSYNTGELWLAEVPVPACGSRGAVVRTTTSFVSAGTERMLVDFARKSLVGKAMQMPDQVKIVLKKMKTEGVSATLDKVKTKLGTPIPLGYSSAGVIEEAGAHLSGFAIGDRVACGGAGYANHSEFNYVPANLLVKIPDNVSDEDASCATVGSIALQGVRQCDLRLGESACVIGLGLLGILAVQMLKASGVRVIGFDPNPERCKLAESLGADVAVSGNLIDEAMSFSRGHGVDAVLVTAATKSNEPITTAAEIARMKGKVVVTGVVGMDIPRDQFYKKELDFKLSLSYGPGRYDSNYEEGGNDYPYGYVRWTEQRNIAAFLDMVSAGTLTPSKLVTHRFDLDDALKAYELLMGETDEPYLGITLQYSAEALDRRRDGIVEFKTPSTSSANGVSFVGIGNFGRGVLLPQVKKIAGATLKGVCSSSGAAEVAKQEGFEFSTTNSDEVFKRDDTGTVFVCTRHNSHAKYVMEALDNNKNVFVEKPLCMNRDEMAVIKEKMANSEARLMVGFNRRFSPHAQLIKNYFAKRKMPMTISCRVNAGIIPPDVWLQDPAIGGGRIVGEVCHFIDLAMHVAGSKVKSVQATCARTDDATLVAEDFLSLNLTMEDGSIANIVYTAGGPADLAKERYEFFADGSYALLDNFMKTECYGKLGKESLKGKMEKGFSEEIGAFFQSIADKTDAPIPADEIFNATEASFAAIEALRSRNTVELGQLASSNKPEGDAKVA